MDKCETCGNMYDKAIQVLQNGARHTFDSFECAIHALAPQCKYCRVRVVGHGVEKEGRIYCCANCAKADGVEGLKDRA